MVFNMLQSSVLILLSTFLGCLFLYLFILFFGVGGYVWRLLRLLYSFFMIIANWFSTTKLFYCLKALISEFNNFIFNCVDSNRYTSVVLWSWVVLAPLLYLVFSRDYIDPFFEISIFVLTGSFSFFVIACFLLEVDFIKGLLGSPAVKTFSLVLFLCVLWMSRVSTSEVLNSAYAVSSSNFPFAMSAGVFIKTFGFLSVPFVLLALFFEFSMIFVQGVTGKGVKGIVRFFCFLISAVVMLYFSCISASYVGLSDRTKFFIVRMAYDFDFVSNFRCDIKYDGKDEAKWRVAYVGDSQSRAIYVRELPDIPKAIRLLTASEAQKYIPSPINTKLINCN